ncbi:AarF/UbiB family protein [uncultured Fusobacterium sp.]|uniref:AarF/UbiB family protein n=1 Tax=uncultured Fusobacterium sp. TaxID=159267 RepID=UPI0015A565E3|nr:AarF/UbiB family protein [uncultured Fusobacterium sp.]
MFSVNFLRMLLSFNSVKGIDPKGIIRLGIIGIRLAQKYSSRIDMLNVENCFYLSDFNTSDVQKEDEHLLCLLPKHHSILSQVEYYDNDSFSYSDINHLFKACLRNGQEITIKVISERAKDIFLKNLASMKQDAKLCSYFMKNLEKKFKIMDMVENLRTESEVKFNLNNEIKCTELMKDFKEEYKNFKAFDRLKFAHIYAYLSSANILVSEYIYGTHFCQLEEERRLSYKDVFDAIRIQLFFIFKIGMYHGNLHMGNIMLSEKGDIYFLDCNNIVNLSDDMREGIFKILKSILRYDYNEIPNFIQELSIKRIDSASLNNVSVEVEKIFRDFKGATLAKNGRIITNLMLSLKSALNNGMEFREELYPLLKSLMYLEIMAEKIAPKRNFTEDMSNIFTEILLYK